MSILSSEQSAASTDRGRACAQNVSPRWSTQWPVTFCLFTPRSPVLPSQRRFMVPETLEPAAWYPTGTGRMVQIGLTFVACVPLQRIYLCHKSIASFRLPGAPAGTAISIPPTCYCKPSGTQMRPVECFQLTFLRSCCCRCLFTWYTVVLKTWRWLPLKLKRTSYPTRWLKYISVRHDWAPIKKESLLVGCPTALDTRKGWGLLGLRECFSFTFKGNSKHIVIYHKYFRN